MFDKIRFFKCEECFVIVFEWLDSIVVSQNIKEEYFY